MKIFYRIFITVCFLFSVFSFEVGLANNTNGVNVNVNHTKGDNVVNNLTWGSSAWSSSSSSCSSNWEKFCLDTLFTNDHISTEKKWITTVESAIWALVKMITWVIWWFAVLWAILWWFFILISWWNESLVTKWKNTIKFSLIWITVSLVSYTLIQLVQMFLFSFSR